MDAMSSVVIWGPPGRCPDLGLRGYLPSLSLGDPGVDDSGVCARLEAGPILADLGITAGDPCLGFFCPDQRGGIVRLDCLLG